MRPHRLDVDLVEVMTTTHTSAGSNSPGRVVQARIFGKSLTQVKQQANACSVCGFGPLMDNLFTLMCPVVMLFCLLVAFVRGLECSQEDARPWPLCRACLKALDIPAWVNHLLDNGRAGLECSPCSLLLVVICHWSRLR